jgi:ABC-type transporter MlaC component
VKNKKRWFLTLGLGILFLTAGCGSDTTGPRELLDKYFSSALKQDYATTYTCYYDAYKAKVNQEEFVKHRKEASVLQAYKIDSIKMPTSDTAQAEVRLTFGPSVRMNRKEPVTVTLKEELVKANGEWKIKVW